MELERRKSLSKRFQRLNRKKSYESEWCDVFMDELRSWSVIMKASWRWIGQYVHRLPTIIALLSNPSRRLSNPWESQEWIWIRSTFSNSSCDVLKDGWLPGNVFTHCPPHLHVRCVARLSFSPIRKPFISLTPPHLPRLEVNSLQTISEAGVTSS